MLPLSNAGPRLSVTSALLVFAAYYCLALLKNHDLVLFPAPYFEDKYFATLPTFGPFDVWQPMGGGYLHLFPRIVSVVIGQFANMAQAPLFLVLYSIALKAGTCAAIALFVAQFLRLPLWFALMVGLAALVMQAASFTLDTLLINTMWNMFVIAALGLIALPVMSAVQKLLLLLFCVLTISSSIGCVLLAVVSGVMLLGALFARTRSFDLSFSPGDIAIYLVVLALVLAYVAFGVDYEMLGVSSMLQQPLPLVSRIATALIIAFERAFVEGSLGRVARELVLQSGHRQLLAVSGSLLLLLAVAWASLRGVHRATLRYPITLVAIAAGGVTLALMVSYSGRYEDGYGAPQHYYATAMLMLVTLAASLGRYSTKLTAALLIVYLGMAAMQWETIRGVAMLGDTRLNHETYQQLADAFLRGECRTETPCIVDMPPWDGVWAIQLSNGQ